MSWMKVVLPIGLLVGAVLLALIVFAARPETERKPAPVPSLLVEVATVERQPVTFMVSSQGAVTPRTSTTLVSEVSGQIAEVAPVPIRMEIETLQPTSQLLYSSDLH